jgi:oxalate decarboxylase/phosphoglucose isomerase-like protein (cupin superfamily)
LTPDDRQFYEITNGSPSLRPSVKTRHVGARRVEELSSVSAVAPPRRTSEIQYWTFTGVSRGDERLPDRLSYDLTFLSAHPIGWERPKTHGHAHPQPELYEVLEGHAAFFVQNLSPGPSADFIVVINVHPGQCVVIPPSAHHVTVNCGPSMLVVADVIARGAQHDYSQMRAARGAAYYQRVDGDVLENPSYTRAPPLMRMSAAEWSDATIQSPLYRGLIERPADFAWLSHPNGFASRFAELAQRLAAVKLTGGRLTPAPAGTQKIQRRRQ